MIKGKYDITYRKSLVFENKYIFVSDNITITEFAILSERFNIPQMEFLQLIIRLGGTAERNKNGTRSVYFFSEEEIKYALEFLNLYNITKDKLKINKKYHSQNKISEIIASTLADTSVSALTNKEN